MHSFLLVDFGTTSTKSALVDLDNGVFSHVRRYRSVPGSQKDGRYEIKPADLAARFLEICDLYGNRMDTPLLGIVLCSEQNGFMALDKDNQPVSNYVSWKDERSLEPVNGVDTFSLLVTELGPLIEPISGVRPGPGLPIMNATHMGRLSALPSRCKLVSLPEWLALCCGAATHVVHDTMLHGLTFYDPRKRAVSLELVKAVQDLCGVQFAFNEVRTTGCVSGYWHGRNGMVPIYVGVGDHQCSVLGACNEPGETISVNIGTGSQVGVIDPPMALDQSETRPYFDNRKLATITRIPGGRALSTFIGFLDDVCQGVSVPLPDFWAMLQTIEEKDIHKAALGFDLSIFGSTWAFGDGGKIEGIMEGSFTLHNYLASLLRSFAQQYATVIDLFDPEHRLNRCILSGGVARKLPLLEHLIASFVGCQTWPATSLDESLLGLRTLALVAAGQANTCIEAQRVFGRACEVCESG